MGFWVATTKNNWPRARLCPSTLTWFSAITSSEADCVRGEARLISSARRMFGEDRAFVKAEGLVPLVEDRYAQNIRGDKSG